MNITCNCDRSFLDAFGNAHDNISTYTRIYGTSNKTMPILGFHFARLKHCFKGLVFSEYRLRCIRIGHSNR